MEENNTVQSYHEGACVYRGDGSLDYILHPEGVVRATGQGLSHECFLKDHLGNTRVVFGSNGAVLQATDYYAFGLEHTPLAISNTNRYLYSGKELQDETFAGGVRLGWYDYGARFYDPAIARWHVVDPHAENYYSWSPYHYAANNPIIMIDPDGRDWYQAVDDEGNAVQGGAVMWREGSDAIDGYSNIGASYTMDLGDGVSMTYNQNTPESMVETVLNAGDWETQREFTYNENGNVTGSRNKAGEAGNCFYQAGQMVSNSGATSLGGTANNINTTDGQTNYINAQIGAGSSVMVHVDYNGDGIGDHWVAISSRTTNLQTQTSSYNFSDPGTVHQNLGTHPANMFNVANGNISGQTQYSNRTYTVIAVRRNQ